MAHFPHSQWSGGGQVMMADAVPLVASAEAAVFSPAEFIVPAGCMVQNMTNAMHNDMIFIPILYGGVRPLHGEARPIRGV